MILYSILGRVEHVARKEEGRSAFRILTGRLTGKRPLGGHGVDRRKIQNYNGLKTVWIPD